VKLTVKYRAELGEDQELVGRDLRRAEAWDALRTQSGGSFGLPRDRGAWESFADSHPEIGDRARHVDGLLGREGVERLASYGVGVGVLELWLHRLAPSRRLELTDYAPRTVEKLAELFPEARVTRHDLSVEPPLDADLHLFHRIDTEFPDRRWRGILRRFSEVPVLVVTGGVISWRDAAREVRKGLARGGAIAGWSRTWDRYEALWRTAHDVTPVDAGGMPAWILRPRG
jgi:hypothetical protein